MTYSTSARLITTVPCRIEFLDGLVQLLKALWDGIDEEETIPFLTAFDEAFTNVVRHGGLDSDAPVEVTAERASDRMTVQLKDRGVDYRQRLEAARRSLDQRPEVPKGTGLYIILRTTSEVVYERDDHNVLTLTRRFGAVSQPPANAPAGGTQRDEVP